VYNISRNMHVPTKKGRKIWERQLDFLIFLSYLFLTGC
jgi:hypothetical protein